MIYAQTGASGTWPCLQVYMYACLLFARPDFVGNCLWDTDTDVVCVMLYVTVKSQSA